CTTAPPIPRSLTIALHDALPIAMGAPQGAPPVGDQRRGDANTHDARRPAEGRDREDDARRRAAGPERKDDLVGWRGGGRRPRGRDRKSTRLNSSHVATSYAVFGL